MVSENRDGGGLPPTEGTSIRDAVGTGYPDFLLRARNVRSSDPDTALLRADSVKGLPHFGGDS